MNRHLAVFAAVTALVLLVAGVAHATLSDPERSSLVAAAAEAHDLANKLDAILATTTTTGGVSSTTTSTLPTATSTSSSTSTTSSTVSVSSTTTIPSASSCTSVIQPGQSISNAATSGTLCLASGIYNQTVTINASNVKIQAAPGAAPILDGSGLSLSKTSDLIALRGSNITFGQGLEIRNVSGRAVTMTGTGDVVQGATVHDVQYNGILAAGVDETIQGNEVYRTVLSNTNGVLGSSGWAEATNTYRATNTTFRDNFIHDNWGEGIDFITSNGGTVTGNTVVNNFSVLIYLGGGDANITIDHNTLSQTVNTYNRSYGVWGILLSSEGGSFVDKVTITNNAYHGTAPAGKAYWTWNVTPTNLVVSGNTFS